MSVEWDQGCSRRANDAVRHSRSGKKVVAGLTFDAGRRRWWRGRRSSARRCCPAARPHRCRQRRGRWRGRPRCRGWQPGTPVLAHRGRNWRRWRRGRRRRCCLCSIAQGNFGLTSDGRTTSRSGSLAMVRAHLRCWLFDTMDLSSVRMQSSYCCVCIRMTFCFHRCACYAQEGSGLDVI